MLGDRGGEIIEPEFAGTATELFESVNVTADKSFETLAVSVQVHFAAVAFHQAESVELARSTVVSQSSEVAPVDIEALAGTGFNTDIGATVLGFRAQGAEIVFDDRFAAIIAERAKPLRDDSSVRGRVLFEEVVEGGLKGIELAAAIAPGRWRSGCVDVFVYGATPEVQVGGDLAQRPLFDGVQPMNGVDLIRVEHR